MGEDGDRCMCDKYYGDIHGGVRVDKYDDIDEGDD
jgi:hypothetical protein